MIDPGESYVVDDKDNPIGCGAGCGHTAPCRSLLFLGKEAFRCNENVKHSNFHGKHLDVNFTTFRDPPGVSFETVELRLCLFAGRRIAIVVVVHALNP
jgi:hypothetical protein